MRVFRANLSTVDPKVLQAKVISEKADIVIARIPSSSQAELVKFERMGFPYLVADTLVYYSVDLTKHVTPQLRNSDLRFVRATVDHLELLDFLVEEIFSNYKNHYSSNPFLAADLIPGYQEWVRSYVTSDDAKAVWVVYRGDDPIAFATCARSAQFEGEGVLYGVMASASGGGVYGDIIRFTQNAYREMGCERFKVSTQVSNFAVQKVWCREGFTLTESYCTVHINALLSVSVRPVVAIPVVVSESDVEACAALTGDVNELHFSDEAAVDAGFKRRIAHGLISNGVLSSYFGTQYPGHGTVFLGYTLRFFAPIYLGKAYTARFTFPSIDEQRGILKSVVLIEDEQGAPCLLAYCDLAKRTKKLT